MASASLSHNSLPRRFRTHLPPATGGCGLEMRISDYVPACFTGTEAKDGVTKRLRSSLQIGKGYARLHEVVIERFQPLV